MKLISIQNNRHFLGDEELNTICARAASIAHEKIAEDFGVEVKYQMIVQIQQSRNGGSNPNNWDLTFGNDFYSRAGTNEAPVKSAIAAVIFSETVKAIRAKVAELGFDPNSEVSSVSFYRKDVYALSGDPSDVRSYTKNQVSVNRFGIAFTEVRQAAMAAREANSPEAQVMSAMTEYFGLGGERTAPAALEGNQNAQIAWYHAQIKAINEGALKAPLSEVASVKVSSKGKGKAAPTTTSETPF